MPRTLAADIVTEVNKTSNTSPFIWLLEIQEDDDNAVRLARYTANVDWPTGDADTYYAYPFEFGGFGESTDGENQTTTVTAYDPRGDLTAAVNDNNGLVDKVAIVRLVHSSHLDETDVLEVRYKISACSRSAEDRTITWTLGEMGVFGWDAPYQLHKRSTCIWKYGSDECGVDTSIPGQYASCNKTWADCVARGIREYDLGCEKKHPRRWGGCKDLPMPRQ